MSNSVTFSPGTVVASTWLNDVDANVYDQLNIAALRLQSKNGPSKWNVVGYNTINDGGGGLYIYDSTDTTSTDNGGTIIVANDGGRWKLQYNGVLSILQFGADKTGVTDSSTAITAALLVSKKITIPQGTFKLLSTIQLNNGNYISGAGEGITVINAYGCNAFSVNAGTSFFGISNLSSESFTSGGSPDPRTFDFIKCAGTNGNSVNYPELFNLYLQGWNRALEYEYVFYSNISGLKTINTNYGIRLFGQCVNNTVSDSIITVNGGVASIATAKDTGGIQGEGLIVTNSILTSGANAFLSDGFLSAGFYNCVCDLLSGNAFDMTGVIGFTFDGPWVYSAQRCFNFNANSSLIDINSSIKCGFATTAGTGQSNIVVGNNNNGVNIVGGTYYLSSATSGYQFFISSSACSIGAVRSINNGSNADVYANATNIHVSSSAILPNGIQWNVSPLTSVASASTLSLPNPGSISTQIITVTGTTGITNISAVNNWAGREVTLRFSGVLTITNGGNLKLLSNYTSTTNSTLKLVSDGTSWFELSRSLNP